MKKYPPCMVRNVIAIAALLLVGSLPAQNLTRFQAQSTGSKVKIDGTSTLHDWTVESLIVGGHMELDSELLANPQKAAPGKVSANVYVTVPVRQLKSGKTPMDNVMHDALKVQQFPKIEYRLKELTLKEAPKSADAPLQFDSKGELAVAGVTNQVAMPVAIMRVDENKLKATGSVGVKMSSFAIKRPGVLGVVTAGDDVKITFDWLTARQEKSADAKTQ